MDTLTTSLLVMGAGAVVAVLGYNAWQQFKSTPRPKSPGHAGTRSEPRLDQVTPQASTADPQPKEAVTDSPSVSSAPISGTGSEYAPDPLVDEIIEVNLPGATPGDRLVALLQGWRRVGSKPVLIEGRVAGETEWSRLGPGVGFEALRISLLLANRRGALNAMEYSEFVGALDKLGDPLGVLIDAPDMGPVLTRARALDAQLIELDAVIGVNVDFGRTLAPGDLIAMAQANDLAERGSERWAKLDAQGQVVYSLSLADAPSKVSLLLDLPRVAVAHQPWQAMLACARKLCEDFQGELLDDQGRLLGEATIQAITTQVRQRQEALVDAGIEPGSVLALRAFN